MRKSDENIKLSITDSSFTQDVFLDEIKTTNVNILLNRVKLDQKKDLRKKIIFISLIISIICAISLFAII